MVSTFGSKWDDGGSFAVSMHSGGRYGHWMEETKVLLVFCIIWALKLRDQEWTTNDSRTADSKVWVIARLCIEAINATVHASDMK